jgi:hypothetical protein
VRATPARQVAQRGHVRRGLLEEGPAGVGQRRPTAMAADQSHAQIALEARDRPADGRLGDAAAAGRRGQRAGGRDLDEQG